MQYSPKPVRSLSQRENFASPIFFALLATGQQQGPIVIFSSLAPEGDFIKTALFSVLEHISAVSISFQIKFPRATSSKFEPQTDHSASL